MCMPFLRVHERVNVLCHLCINNQTIFLTSMFFFSYFCKKNNSNSEASCQCTSSGPQTSQTRKEPHPQAHKNKRYVRVCMVVASHIAAFN